ncbi:MAG: ABC transporter ATP-binding protein [Pirellulaceae bacterium]|jgi:oligopeptide transport system ATP-binding protein|nr:ABC transporter ATP-binding protein [Pirellulaceae bacterium]MDP7019847.1 ABC transporter ATP-binding protein [Pirellulaceae bacterium]
MSSQPLLQVENLEVKFHTEEGEVRAVNQISFELQPGETLGIVGESGSGKSVSNLALLGLIPQPPGEIAGGRAIFRGRDLLKMTERDLMSIRGNDIAMIFQDPMTALNPFLTVEQQLVEVTRRHMGMNRVEARDHAIQMLERVGIPAAAKRVRDYPHQFSGGMRQRVMIAMALSCKPDVLIADEPTTALDVTIQAQILELMKQLQSEEGAAIILVTHDLAVVASICHRVAVMYGGRIVEKAESDRLFEDPQHPYTVGLLESVPRWDQRGSSLTAIDGQPPDMASLPPGCAFADRCPHAQNQCRESLPTLQPARHGGQVACFVDIDAGAEAAS